MIQVFYTLTEIADLLGYSRKSKRAVTKILSALGVPANHINKKVIYYVSDIRMYAPDLYASILEIDHQAKIGNEQRECEPCEGTGRYGFSDDDECPHCHGGGYPVQEALEFCSPGCTHESCLARVRK